MMTTELGTLWQKTSETMPTDRSIKLIVVTETRAVKCAFFNGEWWICQHYQYAPRCVSHWMDLPEAPHD